jgi:hypothetical protein
MCIVDASNFLFLVARKVSKQSTTQCLKRAREVVQRFSYFQSQQLATGGNHSEEDVIIALDNNGSEMIHFFFFFFPLPSLPLSAFGLLN